jgi:hypothetical protein
MVCLFISLAVSADGKIKGRIPKVAFEERVIIHSTRMVLFRTYPTFIESSSPGLKAPSKRTESIASFRGFFVAFRIAMISSFVRSLSALILDFFSASLM